MLRSGWSWPPLQPALPAEHGPLMVGGFVGVVIGLERAVALNRRWAFLAPGLAALAAIAMLVGLPFSLPAALLAGSSAVLAAIFVSLYRLRAEWSTAVMIVGALAWLAGNLLWVLGRPFFEAAPWWAGFLVLTIAGERLELAQLVLKQGARAVFIAACGLLLAALLTTRLSAESFDWGIRASGLAIVWLAIWLFRFDVARRTLRRAGLPRYGAVSLLLGYGWLVLAGLLWAIAPERFRAGLIYDAALHAIFVGFVFSMIFAHAPTIIPAVVNLAFPYQHRLYLPLALLHVSLLIRVAGDLLGLAEERRVGALLNAISMLLFAGMVVRTIRAQRSRPRSTTRT
ncbi:MAG: hypothetical protein IT307_16390 [Chloroflexi bacterium]|nr:hypothetical protein [Chloroflexota bacterium]